MKRISCVSIVGLLGVLVSGGLSSCVAPEGSRSMTVVRSGRPSEIQPKPRPRTRSRQGEIANAIVIAKVVPTPSPSPKAKRTLKTRSNAAPTGSNIPYTFTIESGFCPAGVTSVSATAKCYQVSSLSNGSTPAVSLNPTLLSVFPNGTSQPVPLTPGTPKVVNLNFPATTAGMTVMVIITGTGYDQNDDPFYFSGGDILVVNP